MLTLDESLELEGDVLRFVELLLKMTPEQRRATAQRLLTAIEVEQAIARGLATVEATLATN